MARPREPIDLIIAKNKKHLTKEEIKKRKDQEVKVEFLDVVPPDYLPKKLVQEFEETAYKLKAIGIMTELDSDTLARYLLSKQQYLVYTQKTNSALMRGNLTECEKWNTLQDKAFKQCRMSAADLGLTIASRCKLVVPVVEVEKKPNKFDKFKK